LSTLERQDIRGASEREECSGDGLPRRDTGSISAYFAAIGPAVIRRALGMPLGAPAGEEMHLNLAYLPVSSARSAGKVMITRFFSEELLRSLS
jgi:hypothetical protein